MRKIVRLLPAALLSIFLFSACSALGFRPEYPATYTPLPASPTSPLTTIVPTDTPIPTVVLPTATPYPSGLNLAWVINDYDRTLVAIDPLSQRVIHTVPITGLPVDVAIGEGAVWALESVGNARSNVVRIDPVSNQFAVRIPITTGEALSITTGYGSVWVGVAGDFAMNPAPGGGVEFSKEGTLIRIDPASNQIVETFKLNALAGDLLIEDQVLWILARRASYSYLNKIDMDTRVVYTIPESILSVEYIHKFEHFLKFGVWLWMTPQETDAHYVFRINSFNGKVDTSVSVGTSDQDSPVQITSDGDSIWVALRSGKVVKIDPMSKSVTATIQTEAKHLSDIFYTSGYIWAAATGESMLFQIDPNSSEVIHHYITGNIPPPTPTPTITPTPNPSLLWMLCNEAFPTNLRVGINAIVNQNPSIPNRVRIEPNNESVIIGYIQPGETVEILAGPVCNNGWVWWNIISLQSGLTGWTSEGNGVDYWLIPAPGG